MKEYVIKILKENILELILLIGIIFFSIGFFMLNITIGFIVTGVLLISIIFIVWKGSQKGGD